MLTFERIILRLKEYWSKNGCVITQPYNSEVGAATFNPSTFLRSLGSHPWNVVYVEPTRRPKDGRYAENPNRVQQYHQLQVVMKPAPPDIQHLYLKSLKGIGIQVEEHDVRFVEDDWESPTLGASGLGWEVWMDGLEITQFTYFQQLGGIPLTIIPVEITYGLERIAMYVQQKNSIFDIQWNEHVKWGDIYKRFEYEFSVYNFEKADTDFYFELFDFYEKEAKNMFDSDLLFVGYDFVIKMSHIFNLLDARGAISVRERTKYIQRVRKMARTAATIFKERDEQSQSAY